MADDRIVKDGERTLTVHEMDPGDQLDLIEACADKGSIRGWLAYAMLVCSVTAIDGSPVRMPRNPEQVKDLARKLGNSGVLAVGKIDDVVESGAVTAIDGVSSVSDMAKN